MRTRVRWTLTTETGDVVPYASVRVYKVDGDTLYDGPLYRNVFDDQKYPNPFNASPVRLEFYLDRQTRIVLGITANPGRPELRTPAIEALPNADEVAYSVDPLSILRTEDQLVLRALTPSQGFWYRPGFGDHDHSGPAEDATAVGRLSLAFSEISGYAGATLIGGHDEDLDPDAVLSYGWGLVASQHPTWNFSGVSWGMLDHASQTILVTPSGFEHTTAIGRSALAAGVGTTALGNDTVARELDAASGATTVGQGAQAFGEGVALGANSYASASGAVTAGGGSLAALDGTSMGSRSIAAADGVSLGRWSNFDAGAVDGSVVLGTWTRAPQRSEPTVMVGATSAEADAPVLDDAPSGLALLLQESLTAVISGAFAAQGEVTLGSSDSIVGFFGHAGTSPIFLGNDEVASGIEALDSLIYALRDLGLLCARKDAVARYVPEALYQNHRVGDEIRVWPDVARERTRLLSYLYSEPHYTATDPARFDASRGPIEFLLTENPLPEFTHVITVAQHDAVNLHPHEGLVGVFEGEGIYPDQTQPLARANQVLWNTRDLARFTIDGVSQTPALPVDSRRHVYRVTHRSGWSPSLTVLGASGEPSTWTWRGGISEAAVLDSSWTESAASSYVNGLMFQYGISHAPDWLTTKAIDFLRYQQGDGLNAPKIILTRDYPSSGTKRTVQGRVTGYTGVTIKTVPLLRIGNISTILAHAYEGIVSGYWSYLSNAADYLVELYSFPSGFTGTWSSSALVGRFSLNASGTWSTGKKTCRRGEKRWRLVQRSNFAPVTTDEWVPGCYYDTAVKVYAVDGAGVRTLQDTVPLQGDGTWFANTTAAGRVVAELCRRSTSDVYATTDRRLPADVVARVAEADYTDAVVRGSIRTAALAALAYTGAGQDYWSHAGDILRALTALQDPIEGFLYAVYDVMATDIVPVDTDISTRDLALVGIAALSFGQEVGDPLRFQPLLLGIADYLAAHRDTATGAISDGTAATFSTETSAVGWLFFRNLDLLLGGGIWRVIAEDTARALDDHHWDDDLGRFTLRLGTSTRDTRADTWGGLYQLASGQWSRATQTMRSLAYAKRTGVNLVDDYYTGATALAGYLPTNTSGPLVLDHEMTWAALLFKSRYGAPIGDDLGALRRWTAAGPTTFSQFLNFTADNPGAGLVVRPAATVAAQALLLAQHSRLFWPSPTAAIQVAACRLTVRLTSLGYVFTYDWRAQDGDLPAAFESVAERSFDGGTTWIPMPSRSRQGQISEVRVKGSAFDPWSFSASWTESALLPSNAVTRVNIRIRAREFGSWVTTEARYPNGQVLPAP
jgi:hypothetical protein